MSGEPPASADESTNDPSFAGLSPRRAELLRSLLRAEGIERSSSRKVLPRQDRSAPVPLTFSQSRLWFLNQFTANNPAFVIPVALMVHGTFDLAAFARACDDVVGRHESLRTVFFDVDGRPFQQVHDDIRAEVRVVDLRELTPDDAPGECERRLAELVARPFDLGVGPLLRVELLQFAPDTAAVLVAMHHIVSDLWSIAVLLREIMGSYGARVTGRVSDLPELAVQFPDFARWQQESSAEAGWEADFAYWRRQLAGIPLESGLSLDRGRPKLKTYRGSSVPVELAPAVVAGLRTLARTEGVTLFMVLAAAFTVLVSRLGDNEDIVIGTPVANRPLAELEPLIGFFVNTLALRTDLTGNPSFRTVLREVKRVCLEAYEHQSLPFERLVEELAPQRSLSRTPLFQVMFAYRNMPIPELTGGPIRLDPIAMESRKAEFDLLLDLFEDGDTIWGYLEYSLDVLEEASARRIGRVFQQLLRGLIADPDQRIGELPMMGVDERRRVLAMGKGIERQWTVEGPVANAHVCIVDRYQQPVPVGVVGELYISGDSDAGAVDGPLRTGELGRFRTDGTVEFLGRGDRQIKPRGVRVEPDVQERWTAFEAPRDDLERSIVEIWRELLDVTELGVHDDFFELGGHSMLATQLASQITTAHGIALPIRELFENPTVAELAAWISGRQSGERLAVAPIPAADHTRDIPLSFAQEYLCLHHPWGAEHTVHNVVTGIRLVGALDETALRRSLSDIAERHEALRTRIVGRPKGLVQQVLDVASWPLAEVDLQAMSPSARANELRHLIEAEAQYPFRIDVGPLVRGTLVRLASDESALVLVMHHLVTDNWSYGVLVRDLGEFYQAHRTGREPVLPDLVIQYPDYAAWQQRELASGALDEHLAYWRRQLKDLPALRFTTPPTKEADAASGHTRSFVLDGALAQQLNGIAQQEGATLFMVLLAAFAVLLSTYSASADIPVNFPEAGRDRPETADMVGFFVNILLIRADLSGSPSFRQLVAHVRELTLNAYTHGSVSLYAVDRGALDDGAGEPEMAGSLASSRIRFNLLNASVPAVELYDLVVDSLDVGNGFVFSELLPANVAPAEVDLALIMREHESALRGTWLYSVDAIDARTLSSMMRQWGPLLERLAADPDLDVRKLLFE